MKTLRSHFVLSLAYACATVATGAPMFEVIDVGFLEGGKNETLAVDLNDKGVVIGFSAGRAFAWSRPQGIKDVKEAPGRAFATRAINNVGTAAGVMFYDGTISYDPMVITRSGQSTKFLHGTWADDPNYNYIAQITDAGAVLGNSREPDSNSFRSWIWEPSGGLRFLPIKRSADFMARRMNDQGQIVGVADVFTADCAGIRPFLYDMKLDLMKWLDEAPGIDPRCGTGAAYDINNKGQVVGGGVTSNKSGAQPRAMMWTDASGPIPLSGDDDPTMRRTYAHRINEAGQVVGTFQYQGRSKRNFFYWDEDSGVVDLQKLIDPADPLAARIVLESNTYLPLINEKGWIVVSGFLKDEGAATGPFGPYDPNRTFVLVPIEPRSAKH
jgi:probable HAF family extracellular repeat protein